MSSPSGSTRSPSPDSDTHVIATWEAVSQLMQAKQATREVAELCHFLDIAYLYGDIDDDTTTALPDEDAFSLPTDEESELAVKQAIRAEKRAIEALRAARETLVEDLAESAPDS